MDFKKLLTFFCLVIVSNTIFAQNESFQLRQVACDLEQPWEITYGPDNHLWVTESRDYKLLRIDPNTGSQSVVLDATNLKNFPNNQNPFPQGGFTGVALHPDLLNGKPYVYVAYVNEYDGCQPDDQGCFFKSKIARYDYNAATGTVSNEQVLLDNIPGSNDHNGGRLIITEMGGIPYVVYTVGDMGAGQFRNAERINNAQDPNILEGKILRLNTEPVGGSWIPSSNPFGNAVWSLGHRNPQGLAVGQFGDLYAAEHGPFTDDEVNIINGGNNYGHPFVSGFADGNYNGAAVGTGSQLPIINNESNNANGITNYQDPIASYYAAPNNEVVDWYNYAVTGTQPFPNAWLARPSIAPSGIGYYGQTAIPNWNNSLLITSLKKATIYRQPLSADGQSISAEAIPFFEGLGRFRDVAISPSGDKIYVVCDKFGATSGPTQGTSISPNNPGCVLEFEYAPGITGCQDSYDGFTFIGDFNDAKYFISNETSNWANGSALAEFYGGYLASPNNQAENDFIQSYLQINNEIAFIGVTDGNTEGTFDLASGEPTTFNNFTGTNTDNDDYAVMNFWDGSWGVDNIITQRRYIIEIPCNPVTTNLQLTCASNATFTVPAGSSSAQINYSFPQATTTCPTGGVNITKVTGPSSGDFLNPGIYQVVFSANDECGNMVGCDFIITVESGGCVDNDNDGICADVDCDDNNASLPDEPLSPCNDNNSNTVYDHIRADGCTCMGTDLANCDLELIVSDIICTPTSLTYTIVVNNQFDIPGLTFNRMSDPFDGIFNHPYGEPVTITVNLSDFGNPNTQLYPYTIRVNDPFDSAFTCDASYTINECDSTPTCNVVASPFEGGVDITGLNGTENTKLFDADIDLVWECNPWNNNPCTGNEVITGLAPGTYFLSVQSDVCNEWIPIEVEGSIDCNIEVEITDIICELPEVTFTINATGTGIGIGNNWGTFVQTDELGNNFFISRPYGQPTTITQYVGNDPGVFTLGIFDTSPGADCSAQFEIGCTNNCTDADNDGFCADEDCDDNNASIPAPPGTPCDDNDGSTQNDAILADGCTCQGTFVSTSLSIDCPDDITLQIPTGATTIVANWPNATASSTCPQGLIGAVQQVGGVPSGTVVEAGSYFITYFAEDNCGLNGTCSITATVLPADGNGCNVSATISENNITITGLTSGENTKLFDENFGIVWECNPFGASNVSSCTGNEDISNLPLGNYFLSVQSGSCDEFILLTIDGSGCIDVDGDGVCATDDCNDNEPFLPTNPGTPCNDNDPSTENDVYQADGCTCMGTSVTGCTANVDAFFNGVFGGIELEGLAESYNVKIFDADFNIIYQCNPWGDPQVCQMSWTQLISESGGTFFVSIQSENCDEFIPVTIPTDGTCIDTDNDGVCNSEDCEPTNPSIPAPVGSSCNDFDVLTENDMILANGCTCAGTPIAGQCNVSLQITDFDEVTVTGLSNMENVKIFDSSANSNGIIWECNPWSSPCNSSEIIDGLIPGENYFLSVQSDNCNEWVPFQTQASPLPESISRIKINKTKEFVIQNVFPNPTNNEAFINVESNYDGEVLLEIYNTIGSLQNHISTNIIEGNNAIELNVKDLKTGIYHIVIKDQNGQTKYTRIVKQN